MIVFTLKFWDLLVTQMALITNVTFLHVNCKLTEFLFEFLTPVGDWLNACVAIERAVTITFGANFSKSISLLASKVVAVIVIVFTITIAIHDPLNRRLIVDEEDQRTWCVVSYVHLPSLNIFNTGLNITHFILPFAINFISAFIIILTTARKRSIARTQQTYCQHLRKEFQQHKHLIISPCILVLLALPRLIISFFSGCMKSERNPWLYFAGYFVSFI
ncbi:unnamed protein product, partial [Didymodactylos carnosus]